MGRMNDLEGTQSALLCSGSYGGLVASGADRGGYPVLLFGRAMLLAWGIVD